MPLAVDVLLQAVCGCLTICPAQVAKQSLNERSGVAVKFGLGSLPRNRVALHQLRHFRSGWQAEHGFCRLCKQETLS